MSARSRVYPNAFRATFSAVFGFIYRLRGFDLSAVTNDFELRCRLKQLLLLYNKICP